MTLDHFVPFVERVRYGMLKAALDEGVSAKQLAKRMGFMLSRVRYLVMDEGADPSLSEIATWHYSVNGSRVKFSFL
ncbi:hypothetical protein P7F60_12110 [Rhizobium sp. YJ-22]|uniref:hypothetical protein n=1 Tax=Rhizobium sp. YJ-22 TaxID=3037556 RepID=UPI002412BBBE|nr:hypothetical protein [Rhizobium sp. YJ-22]MDG3577137.1 hypothetical protein [Rhizobium sp. YJ-22]